MKSGCRKLGKRSVGKRKEAMAYFSVESGTALAISLVINVCVVAVFAKVLELASLQALPSGQTLRWSSAGLGNPCGGSAASNMGRVSSSHALLLGHLPRRRRICGGRLCQGARSPRSPHHLAFQGVLIRTA